MPIPTSLAAVLFVELDGFNELFASDEASAMELLKEYREIVNPIVDEHAGDIVDATGSELLVVFVSAVSAVQCGLLLALALRNLCQRSGKLPFVKARLGIHLGEIWRDGDRVYGNGVNVAARVMQTALPGTFLVSEDVYRQVSGKLDLAAREVGDVVLKNIDRPLVLYEVDSGRGFLGVATGHTERKSAASGAGYSSHAGGSTHEAAPSTSKLAMELRHSITRDVQEALATTRVTRSKTGHGITIDIGPDASDRSVDRKPVRAPASTATAGDPETRREKLSDRIAAATKSLVMSGGIAAGLGYGYVATGKWPLALGAAIVILAPFLSSLKQLITASSEIRLIDKRDRRKAGKS
jgi:class 3 adenylate cyclase